MANRLLLGFEDVDTTSMLTYEVAASGFSPAVSPNGRNSGNCLRLASAASAHFVCCPEGQSTVHFGFAFRTSAFPASQAVIAGFSDWTTTHVLLQITATGNLRWYRYNSQQISLSGGTTQLGSTGSTSLSLNTYYWLSGTVTIDSSSGVALVKINGTTELNLTSQNTRNSATANVVAIGFGTVNGNTDIDDVVVNDATGSTNNAVPADSRVDCHLPNGNGNSSAWTRSTGANQYATIDEAAANGDTDYNGTSTLNAIDTVTMEDFKNPGATIQAVQVNILSRKTDSGSCSIAPVIRINATDNVGTARSPGTSYAYQRQNYDVQPDATDWNEADFNAMECGYKKTA